MPSRPTSVGRGPAAAMMGARRTWSRAPLRVKLAAILVLLVAVALAGSAIAGVATMRAYLTDRVDTQLHAVADQPIDGLPIAGSTAVQGPGDPDGDHDGGPGRLPSSYVVAVTDSDGHLAYGPTSELLDAEEPLPQLPTLTAAQVARAGERAFTTPAVSGDGQWRVLASPTTLSDGAAGTLLVAQSLGDVEGTVDRMTVLFAVIGVIATLIVGALGYLIVRASLTPLRRVEDTAAAIAAGDLTRRLSIADPRTEIGQLSTALNGMLTDIETAFEQRQISENAARRSEDQMRASEAAARRSEARMRRFVADASHELRTPLTTIRGFAELYRQDPNPDATAVAQMMRRIEDEAARMGALVDDLLMLARLDQQRPLDHDPVDLLALCADATQDARAVDPDRPISLRVGNTDPPPIVLGDEARLRQVLGNLINNALRHTPARTPVQVRLSTDRPDGHDGGVVRIEVADQGPGMTPDDAARVFERFYRTDQSRNRNDGGAGLGLSIVGALIDAHGGQVDVDTAPDAGCCFRVLLPLADPTSAA